MSSYVSLLYASQPCAVFGPFMILRWKNGHQSRSASPLHFDQTLVANTPSFTTQDADFSKIPIAAIFVFHDPRNWALDIQVMCDVIQSGGIIGGPYVSECARKPVDLVFCNPDHVWRSDFDRPRIGQGTFKEAFQTVFKVNATTALLLVDDQIFAGVDGRNIPMYSVWKTN